MATSVEPETRYGKQVMVGGTQMPTRVSNADWDAVLQQRYGGARPFRLVNCHCQLEENRGPDLQNILRQSYHQSVTDD